MLDTNVCGCDRVEDEMTGRNLKQTNIHERPSRYVLTYVLNVTFTY